jgi:hypothetical protein
VAAQLYPKINVFKEFQKYSADVARRTHREIVKCAVRQLIEGPDDQNFVKLQQIAQVGNGFLNWAQRLLEDPRFNFAAVAGKIYAAIRSFARFLLLTGSLATSVGLIYVGTYVYINFDKLKPEWSGRLADVTPAGWFFITAAVVWFLLTVGMLLAYGRRVYLRFGDLDD